MPYDTIPHCSRIDSQYDGNRQREKKKLFPNSCQMQMLIYKTEYRTRSEALTMVDRVTMFARIQSGASSPPHKWNLMMPPKWCPNRSAKTVQKGGENFNNPPKKLKILHFYLLSIIAQSATQIRRNPIQQILIPQTEQVRAAYTKPLLYPKPTISKILQIQQRGMYLLVDKNQF